MDLGTTIEPKSDQLNADDLILGPMTIRINNVKGSSEPQQPISISFDGDHNKPYKPCKSMRRVLVSVWGRDGLSYIGKSMTLYRDDKVVFGGVEVGGIRISHMSGIDDNVTMALTASKTKRKPFTVKPLRNEPNTPTDPEVKAAGDEAAAGGVESYTTWLASLTPDVKETVKWLHKEWSRVAKAVVVPDEVEFDDVIDETDPPDHIDESVTAPAPPDLDPVDEPRSEESQLADVQLAITERRTEIGDEAYEKILNGRSTRSMDLKAAKALLKELTK